MSCTWEVEHPLCSNLIGGTLYAGPALASLRELAIAWLVWCPSGIDNEVLERGIALTKHVTPA